MYSTFIFDPLYNTLVYLVGILPGGDVGLAVIVLTLMLRIILLPLARKAHKMQVAMRTLQPQLDEIKKRYASDPKQHMAEMQKVYKEAGVSPFSSILLLLIQLPILIGLYQVFHYGHLTNVDTSLLYSFVAVPSQVSIYFLGFIDMYGKSISLALLAGVTQYIFAYVMPAQPISDEKNFMNDFAKSMQTQMKYVFPVLIAVVSFTTSAAIALYLVVSNLVSIAQEVYNKKTQKV